MKPIEAWAIDEGGSIPEIGLSHDELCIYADKAIAQELANDAEVVPVLIVPRAAVREAWALVGLDGEPVASNSTTAAMVFLTKPGARRCKLRGERVARVGIVELDDE